MMVAVASVYITPKIYHNDFWMVVSTSVVPGKDQGWCQRGDVEVSCIKADSNINHDNQSHLVGLYLKHGRWSD